MENNRLKHLKSQILGKKSQNNKIGAKFWSEYKYRVRLFRNVPKNYVNSLKFSPKKAMKNIIRSVKKFHKHLFGPIFTVKVLNMCELLIVNILLFHWSIIFNSRSVLAEFSVHNNLSPIHVRVGCTP